MDKKEQGYKERERGRWGGQGPKSLNGSVEVKILENVGRKHKMS